MFVESIIREDRNVLDLLTADYTFVNERLARHYGIPNVYGSRFRRVTLPDENRRGLLGQGTVLAVTSYPNRTSPVLRGKWILENVLGTPPPPPPPNVPTLRENGEGGKVASVRERLEQHRKDPGCATCHRVMDPLGFSLDNFDATGEWRTNEAVGIPVDATGQLADGTPVNGPIALRQAMLEAPGTVRPDDDREIVDLWSRPRSRALRYADRPRDRQRCRQGELPVLFADRRHRQERSVSDEESVEFRAPSVERREALKAGFELPASSFE